MNLDQEILKLIVDLAHTGGQTAIWLVVGIQVIKLISTSIGWIFWLWFTKIVTGMISGIFKFCIEKDARILEKEYGK